MPDEEKEIVELNNESAIVELPENCVEVTLQCKVYLDGKLQTVIRTMDMKEILDAKGEYKVAEEIGYISPDAIFTLTDEGKRYAEELARRENGY